MRVLLVSAHFQPHVGGIERFTQTLAEGLTARGHVVTVLCCRTECGSPLDENADAGYRVVRVPSSTFPDRRLRVPYPLPSPRPLWLALRRELARADVVHVQDALYTTSIAALVLARRAGVPALLTLHVGFVPQGRAGLDTLERLALATLGRSARLASRVVALNPEVADFARRTWELREVTVEPVGVPSPPEVDRASARAELGIAPDRFVALFVGRDVPKKGLDHVLAAADEQYEIVAVTDRPGPGPPGTTLLRFMEHERLQRIYAAADAFVLPSVGEGIPVALQEAMSHGLPIVAHYDEGYRERFSRTDIFPVERSAEDIRRALLELVANPALRHELTVRSRAVREHHFGVDRFVDRTVELYLQLLRISHPRVEA